MISSREIPVISWNKGLLRAENLLSLLKEDHILKFSGYKNSRIAYPESKKKKKIHFYKILKIMSILLQKIKIRTKNLFIKIAFVSFEKNADFEEIFRRQ